MDATMGSIAPTGLKGKLAALEERSFLIPFAELVKA